MAKKWSEVIKNPEYLKLSIEDQKFAQEQYFREVVQPQVSEEDIPIAREQFFTDISKPELPPEVISDAVDFHQLSFEEQTKIIGKEPPFKSADVSTITGQPSAELETFPDLAKAGDVIADLAPPIGGTVGGISGAAGGGGWMSAPLGIWGAAKGGVLGEMYRQAWYKLTGRGETPKTTVELIEKIGEAGAEEMLWEGIGAGAGRILRPLSKIGKRAAQTAPIEGPLTFGEAMNKGWGKTVVETIENIGTLGRHNVKKTEKIKQATIAARANIYEGLQKGEHLHDMLHKVLTKEHTGWNKVCDHYYNEINKELRTVATHTGKSEKFIDTKILKQEAKRLSLKAKRAGIGGDAVTNLEQILKMEDLIDFETAKLRWGAMYNTADKTLNKQLSKMGTEFKKDVGKQIELFDDGGATSFTWKTIDKVYKEGKDMFDVQIIKKIIDGMSSDDLHRHILKANNGDNINLIKKTMSGEISTFPTAGKEFATSLETKKEFVKTWKKLQVSTYDKLLEKATDVEDVLGGNRLKTQLKKLGTTADAVFNPSIFEEKNIKENIGSLANHLAKIEAKPGKLNWGTIALAMPVGGGIGYGLVAGEDPIGTIKSVTLVGSSLVGSAAIFGLLSRTKTGLEILKQFTQTAATNTGRLTSLTLRANRFLERREKREAWLEQREEKRTSERKETVQPEQPITKRPIDFLRGILPTQHPKTKPIINQTVGGTRASLGGNNDFLTQLLLS